MVLDFAEKELEKYLYKITQKSQNAIKLEVDENKFDKTKFILYDNKFDDAYIIDVKNGIGTITGINQRSVLLGIYAFLKKLGCMFMRTGEYGEFIPKKSLMECSISAVHYAYKRHRGITLEGANSLENVLDIIDIAPKLGFNSYFIQFENGYIFFERWYTHKNNNIMGKSEFDIKKIYDQIVNEIKRRGMFLHAVGHGWTARAIGSDTEGWNKSEDTKDNELIALVKGNRKFFNGIPSNTNLCYSNKRAREVFTNSVVSYCKLHLEIDILHIWLADDNKNFCECNNCSIKSPSDWYVNLLNEIDKKLTEENIDIKIAFLIYFELLWAPKTERFINKNRFILMFAPITRTYTKTYFDSFQEQNPENKIMQDFQLNKMTFPTEPSKNLIFLDEWKKIFNGDNFLFDYPLLLAGLKDLSSVRIPEVINSDVTFLKQMGLNGIVSCQVQRVFFPHGFAFYILGKSLIEGNIDYDYEKQTYFKNYYGKLANEVINYFNAIGNKLPLENFCQESYKNNEINTIRLKSLKDDIIKIKIVIGSFIAKNDIQQENCYLLQLHICIMELIIPVLIKKIRKKDFTLEKNKFINFLKKSELFSQPYLDTDLFMFIYDSVFESDWIN